MKIEPREEGEAEKMINALEPRTLAVPVFVPPMQGTTIFGPVLGGVLIRNDGTVVPV